MKCNKYQRDRFYDFWFFIIKGVKFRNLLYLNQGKVTETFN
jgi:hypothetical protein